MVATLGYFGSRTGYVWGTILKSIMMFQQEQKGLCNPDAFFMEGLSLKSGSSGRPSYMP